LQEGALQLSRSFTKLTTTVTNLDMSFCWIDSCGGSKVFQDIILHKGLVKLNLSGNQLEERVGALPIYQLRHFFVLDRFYIQVYAL
jgi:hypothetical protein